MPDVNDLRKLILSEAHDTAYSIHPGSTKMYYDLKERFWWYGMKRSVAEYVAICDTCQRVKAEHQRPASLLQPLKIPEWKMGGNHYGLHCGIASYSERVQLHMGSSGSSDESCSLHSSEHYLLQC